VLKANPGGRTHLFLAPVIGPELENTDEPEEKKMKKMIFACTLVALSAPVLAHDPETETRYECRRLEGTWDVFCPYQSSGPCDIENYAELDVEPVKKTQYTQFTVMLNGSKWNVKEGANPVSCDNSDPYLRIAVKTFDDKEGVLYVERVTRLGDLEKRRKKDITKVTQVSIYLTQTDKAENREEHNAEHTHGDVRILTPGHSHADQ
jgi:hypothetical protein